ncbi:MAG TPA: hypothetical protein P5234_00360 [Thermoanaerobaculaceae bacterium]|nr:hypothetical protein [Thermoanaerobaculaceae bacterium]HRS14679.1 hypothetical protein [Thermoanaerobaculaceae bacterium]
MAPPAALAALVAALAAGPAASATLAELQRALPARVGELEATGTGEIWGPERIFDYLDGGAEVYLAYGLVGCLAREYTGTGMTVVADVFELSSPADAFGVFTHDQDGEEVPVGQGALLRPGWLSFWKGPFFVSLTADADTRPAQRTLVELAGAIAAAIPVEGKPPELLRWLPARGLVPRSARYFHSPVLLRTHLPRIEGNPLLLAPDTEAVLGRVKRGAHEAVVIVARYPSAGRAREAMLALARERTGAGKPLAPGSAAGRNGDRVAWVVLSSSSDLSIVLMGEALGLSAKEVRRLRRGGSDVRMF